MDFANVVDDQPMAAGFFKTGHWLTSYITPDELEVQALYDKITQGAYTTEDKIYRCWSWVANQVRYEEFIRAKIWVEGKTSVQDDYWQKPSMCINTKVGNCANKSFLLASLLRNEMSPGNVYCVLGNLYNGKVGGHAWVEVNLNGNYFIVEPTRNDVAFIPEENADRYEPVHYFTDEEVRTVPGRSVMEPYMACYSDWLKDYLDWAYIEGRK